MQQKEIASKVKLELQELVKQGKVSNYQTRIISTEIREAMPFFEAQDDHQRYLEKNPWGYCNHGRK